MFKWLTFISRRRPAREIFEYSDGLASRTIDPLSAFYELHGDPDRFSAEKDLKELALLSEVKNPTPKVVKASHELVQRINGVVRDVFDVKDYDSKTGEGLTLEEQLELLGSFIAFMDGVKKKQDRLQKRWGPTESESPDETGEVPVPEALTGPADISADELDEMLSEWEAKTSTIPVMEFSDEDNSVSSDSSEATTEPSDPPPVDEKSSTPSDSDSSSTSPELTSADQSSASRQLLQRSTPSH